MNSFTDWLGNEISVGDTVIYPVSSGGAMALALAVVDSINTYEDGSLKSVTVSLLERDGSDASRWHHGWTYTRYIDSQTGKGIDPDAGNGKHIAIEAHYVNRVNKNKISIEGYYNLPLKGTRWGDWEYVPSKFKDYVQQIKLPPKPRTLTVIENITKVEVNKDG